MAIFNCYVSSPEGKPHELIRYRYHKPLRYLLELYICINFERKNSSSTGKSPRVPYEFFSEPLRLSLPGGLEATTGWPVGSPTSLSAWFNGVPGWERPWESMGNTIGVMEIPWDLTMLMTPIFLQLVTNYGLWYANNYSNELVTGAFVNQLITGGPHIV